MEVVVAVLDTGINEKDMKAESYLPEKAFHPKAAPAALKAHGTDVCNTILHIAPEAMVLPVQITNVFGQLDTPSLEAALDWILREHRQMNIKIICAAFADYTHRLSDLNFEGSKVKQQVSLLKEQGVVLVAAAGNWYASFKDKATQGMAWPAILREVVSVGALDDTGQIAAYSQRLNKAMDTACATTVFAIPAVPGDTSGATAVVSGILTRLYLQQPELSVEELIKLFESGLQKIKDEDGNQWPVFIARCEGMITNVEIPPSSE